MAGTGSRFEFSGLMSGEEWRLKRASPNKYIL